MKRCWVWVAIASAGIGCLHVDVDSSPSCDVAHFALQDLSIDDAARLGMMIPDGGWTRPTTVSLKTSVSAALPNFVDFEVDLSPLTLRLQGGDWRFADRIVVIMEGSRRATTPPITIADHALTPEEARSSVLNVPLVVPSSTMVTYLRHGAVQLTLTLVAHALPPPSGVDLEVCHSASASFNWNVVGGAS